MFEANKLPKLADYDASRVSPLDMFSSEYKAGNYNTTKYNPIENARVKFARVDVRGLAGWDALGVPFINIASSTESGDTQNAGAPDDIVINVNMQPTDETGKFTHTPINEKFYVRGASEEKIDTTQDWLMHQVINYIFNRAEQTPKDQTNPWHTNEIAWVQRVLEDFKNDPQQLKKHDENYINDMYDDGELHTHQQPVYSAGHEYHLMLAPSHITDEDKSFIEIVKDNYPNLMLASDDDSKLCAFDIFNIFINVDDVNDDGSLIMRVNAYIGLPIYDISKFVEPFDTCALNPDGTPARDTQGLDPVETKIDAYARDLLEFDESSNDNETVRMVSIPTHVFTVRSADDMRSIITAVCETLAYLAMRSLENRQAGSKSKNSMMLLSIPGIIADAKIAITERLVKLIADDNGETDMWGNEMDDDTDCDDEDEPYNAIFDDDNALIEQREYSLDPDRHDNIDTVIINRESIDSCNPFIEINDNGEPTTTDPIWSTTYKFTIQHVDNTPDTEKELICILNSAEDCDLMSKYISTKANMLFQLALNDMDEDDVRQMLQMAISQTRLTSALMYHTADYDLTDNGFGPGHILNELNDTAGQNIGFDRDMTKIAELGSNVIICYKVNMPANSPLRLLHVFAEDDLDINKQTGFIVLINCVAMGFDPDIMCSVGYADISVHFFDEDKNTSEPLYLRSTGLISLNDPENMLKAIRQTMVEIMDWTKHQIEMIKKTAK